MVEVVGEPYRHAPVDRGRQRPHHGLRERVGKAQVVDRDVERALRGSDPIGERTRRLLRRLPAVGERADLYVAAFVRCAALYARFAAWYSARSSGEVTSPSVG